MGSVGGIVGSNVLDYNVIILLDIDVDYSREFDYFVDPPGEVRNQLLVRSRSTRPYVPIDLKELWNGQMDDDFPDHV